MRGVMSPHKFTDDDLETLHKWNVKLVRAQITRDWGKANTDRDLAEYDRWLDGKLDHLEEVFKKASPFLYSFCQVRVYNYEWNFINEERKQRNL